MQNSPVTKLMSEHPPPSIRTQNQVNEELWKRDRMLDEKVSSLIMKATLQEADNRAIAKSIDNLSNSLAQSVGTLQKMVEAKADYQITNASLLTIEAKLKEVVDIVQPAKGYWNASRGFLSFAVGILLIIIPAVYAANAKNVERTNSLIYNMSINSVKLENRIKAQEQRADELNKEIDNLRYEIQSERTGNDAKTRRRR